MLVTAYSVGHRFPSSRRATSLKPSEVCKEFATKCLDYGARTVKGDLHYADTAHEELPKTRGPTSAWFG